MTLGAKVSSTRRPSDMIRGDGVSEPTFQVGAFNKTFTACALWDDSVDGHLPVQVSNGGMGLGVFLPKYAQAIRSFHNVLVVPVGPTNMGASLEADFDLIASAAISGTPWEATGLYEGVLVAAASTAEELASATLTDVREIQLVATVAVSSAGRVAIYVDWMPGVSSTQGAS